MCIHFQVQGRPPFPILGERVFRARGNEKNGGIKQRMTLDVLSEDDSLSSASLLRQLVNPAFRIFV